MFDLSGKTAFITGSARGIGLAIARALAAAGAKALMHGATASGHLAAAAADLGADFVVGDLCDPEAVDAMAAEAQAKTGGVDILVLNGSVQTYTGLGNFEVAEFQRQMQANVASSFQLIRFFAPRMAEKKFGRIISVSSINQVRPAERLAVYSTTKAALANLTAMTAKRHAADGVTANTILPGVIETDRNREALSNPAFADTLRDAIPARRFGAPADCAGIAVFLASDEASYVTGAEIPVAGGWQL
ncbi:MAG: SDR family NAD(P)-dependent oxidoreductase [Kiritimatiellia bacterium]|jgi:NAD(P)-dependent dehydrogenase (short-subunit alcohol dehydrogenase family)